MATLTNSEKCESVLDQCVCKVGLRTEHSLVCNFVQDTEVVIS